MAKDVDLSSQQWRDLVFEGKNKEFGAYVLRADSPKRHTRAVLIVVSALILILLFLILAMTGVFSRAEDETAVNTEQELAVFNSDDEVEEEEEEDFQKPEEPEKEEIFKEEVANETRVTALNIVEDEKVEDDKKVKEQDELRQTDIQFGTKDVTDGVDDRTKQRIQDQVIVDKPVEPKKETVYTMAMVEQKPEFPGGDAAMYKWLSEHINYPAAASEAGVEGRVIVEFVVSKTGAVQNARVVRGKHPALDQEALRVVKMMPKWNPGRNNGQPVSVTYNLPVTFKLQK